MITLALITASVLTLAYLVLSNKAFYETHKASGKSIIQSILEVA